MHERRGEEQKQARSRDLSFSKLGFKMAHAARLAEHLGEGYKHVPRLYYCLRQQKAGVSVYVSLSRERNAQMN